MSVEYISSLNGGQLSPLLIPRSDLPAHKNGCSVLENFYVLPAGGVERRQGSQYILEADSDNSRLFPFSFSSDESYIIEISENFINIIGPTGTILDTITSIYDVIDIQDIKIKQIVDIVYITCTGKPLYKLQRILIDPVEFELVEVEFSYPIFNDENIDKNNTIAFFPILWTAYTEYDANNLVTYDNTRYSAKAGFTSTGTFVVANWDEVDSSHISGLIGDNLILHSNEGIFNSQLENSYFRVSHQRALETIMLEGVPSKYNSSYGTITSDAVYIGDKTVSISFYLNYEEIPEYGDSGEIKVQKRTGTAGTWTDVAGMTYTNTGSVDYSFTGAGSDYIRIVASGQGFNSSYSVTKPLGKRIEYTATTSGKSDPLDVSFSDWTITTGGTWVGALELEKSVDGGGTWNTELFIIDTTGVNPDNITIASPFKEKGNTLIRLVFEFASGELKANLINNTFRSEGLFKIIEFIDENNVTAEIINIPVTYDTSSKWNEAAFSEYRGYPSAIEFHENRMVLSGSKDAGNKVYFSYTDDYTNFLEGTKDSDAIYIVPNTNEQCTWLLSRGDVLYQGTRGSVVTIKPAKAGQLSPTNISALESLEFGGSDIQAIKTNETTVYLERLNTKLREVFYSDEEQGLVSRDLTILSNEIAAQGFTELVLQRTPDQIIYGLRSDGKLAGLTYERSQEVFGWSVFDFGDEISSIAVRPSGTHDELWMIVKRDGGTYIEKTGSRVFSDDLLDAWYVDSGVKTVLKDEVKDAIITIGPSPNFKITISKTSHDYNDGDLIKFDTSATTELNGVYIVGDATANNFVLKTSEGDDINYAKIENLSGVPTLVDITNTGTTVDGRYFHDPLKLDEDNVAYFYKSDNSAVIKPAGTSIYSIEDIPFDNNWLYFDYATIPPETGWGTGPEPYPVLVYYADITGTTCSFTEVENTWSGLNHLEGSEVQIMGDGGFAGTATVVSGSVTSDHYYNQTVIGLRYFSVMQPMYIESAGFSSQYFNKRVNSTVIGFYRTIGGYSGIILQTDDRNPVLDWDDINSNWPNLCKEHINMEAISFRKYDDAIGSPIKPFNGNKKINFSDTLSRIKGIFVIADAPSPMTIQSLALSLNTKGK